MTGVARCFSRYIHKPKSSSIWRPSGVYFSWVQGVLFREATSCCRVPLPVRQYDYQNSRHADSSIREIVARSEARGHINWRERTVVQGEPLLPTPHARQRYQLVDPTRNGVGKPKREYLVRIPR